jgi:hypothetical protein
MMVTEVLTYGFGDRCGNPNDRKAQATSSLETELNGLFVLVALVDWIFLHGDWANFGFAVFVLYEL